MSQWIQKWTTDFYVDDLTFDVWLAKNKRTQQYHAKTVCPRCKKSKFESIQQIDNGILYNLRVQVISHVRRCNK